MLTGEITVCCFYTSLINQGKDDAAFSLSQDVLEQDLKEPTEEPTLHFGAEFQNRLKHLGLWFDAVFEDSYHLFLKNLPDTEFMLRVQSPTSLFVVWETRPPSNTILSKIAKLPYGCLQVTPTTASTTFKHPFPVKESNTKWEKIILNNEKEEPFWVQYIFQKKSVKEEVIDKPFIKF
jgi:hypothetical protein